MKKLIPAVSLLLLASFALSGCETSGQNALLGAGTGAAIGGLLHGRGDQALAGAAIGAAGGFLLGKALQYDRRRTYSEGYYDAQGDRSAQDRYAPSDDENYPMGRSTGSAGLVTSPYYPYNRIEVRGIPRGAKVVDPTCRKLFINP